jgi:hypothetical protein
LLVKTFAAAGGVGKAKDDGTIVLQKILFNDTKGIAGVMTAEGHYNHLHVCFPVKSPKVQEACRRSVN